MQRQTFIPGWRLATRALAVLCLAPGLACQQRATAVQTVRSAAGADIPDPSDSSDPPDPSDQDPQHPEAVAAEPEENLLLNGGFEEPGGTGPWYYVRWGRVVEREDGPPAGHCMRFESQMPGLEAQAQQTVRLDGRRLFAVRLSASVKGEELAPGQSFEQQAVCRIAFYDEAHKPLSGGHIGPWQGTFAWTRQQAIFPVPRRARVAIVWIGLMGGTGRAWFDDVSVEPADVNPSIFTPP
ncbi:MAG: hypothetical protein K6T86_10030 [Pirellulales bacterium]|nr:hypothetical protein [Pirellulales bacterium]